MIRGRRGGGLGCAEVEGEGGRVWKAEMGRGVVVAGLGAAVERRGAQGRHGEYVERVTSGAEGGHRLAVSVVVGDEG